MSGLTQILETARRALSSQRAGLNVASHNIANASTEGYSRQRITFQATPPEQTSLGLLGTGVTIAHVGRIRERFIDQQIRAARDSYGESTAQQRVLSQIEAVMNEPSAQGLQSALNRLFNAFRNLAQHPEEPSARNDLLQQALQLSQSFRRLNGSLVQLRNGLLSDVQNKTERINQLTDEIAQLNRQIVAIHAAGQDPSDIKDQLDVRLDELSQLVPVKMFENAAGAVSVSIGGTMVASSAGSVPLKLQISASSASIVIASSGRPVSFMGGEVGGILDSYNSIIPGYLQTLDDLAQALISRVNAIHSTGYGLGTPPPTGVNFFSGTGAADIDVDASVRSNVNAIAASRDGSPGNNEIALALAGVEDERLVAGNTLTLGQSYRSFVSQVGSAITSAETTSKAQELVLMQLENQRNSVSGVSLDEEMANMIRYQRSFDAAARMVSTVNEMFETILRMV
jgi:flagellar hook-associated protein 1 FlgK